MFAALLCASSLQAQTTQATRAVAVQDATEMPQFTIQVDAFETLTEAVEFGYELPFDENTLGLAKFRQGTAVRYILALGTFYNYGEAEDVLQATCPSAALLNCRVRYLGDLESIDAEGSKPQPAVAAQPKSSEPAVDTDYFEQQLDEEDEFLAQPVVQAAVPVQTPRVVSARTPEEISRAYDGELVYTVQVAAMYERADSDRIARKIPSAMGAAEVYPYVGGRGNVVHSVTVGRFAYKDKAEAFAKELCAAVGVSGCWVKPLSMIERELAAYSNTGASLPSPKAKPKARALAANKEITAPTLNEAGDERVYTVQVAAMYDETDAQGVANRIPAQFGSTEVVPIRSATGDVVYSVTVGRFAYREEGQDVADTVCNRLSLSGCWVKPFALIEKARVEEW